MSLARFRKHRIKPDFHFRGQNALKLSKRFVCVGFLLSVFKSFKINSYFQLKSCTPLALFSNVVYKFTCSCDTNLTYIGMFSRHLSTRVREHLNLNSKQKSSIKDHIAACNFCSKTKIGIDSFKIIRKCRSDYDTKIHEALLIKKHSPGLNRELYASGASFLLQVS